MLFGRFMVLLCLISSAIWADTWRLDTFSNSNVTQQEIKKIEVKEDFQATFGVNGTVSDLTTYRLQKKMLNAYDKGKDVKVDIFISDTTPVIDLYNGEELVGFVLIADPKSDHFSVSTRYGKLNDTERQALFDRYRERKQRKNDLRFKARQANLQTLLSLLDNDLDDKTKAKLQKAADKGARYVSLKLSPQAIISLLTYHNGAIGALDEHIDFSSSATADPVYHIDQDMRDAWLERLDTYVAKTYIHSKKADPDLAHLDWEGSGVNIYYSDPQCPKYNDQNKTYFGYTPVNESRYTIEAVYDEQGNLFEGNSNLAYHTKVITGILSTVSSEANLTCKNQIVILPETNYDDLNATIYDIVLPDDNAADFIESYSLNKYASAEDNDSTRDYYPMDALFDNHAYDDERLIFIAAGNNHDDNPEGDYNPGNDVVSPGKAFNVVTVGNYRIDENGLIVINDHSAYNNPFLNGVSSYQKPEVSAPGTDYFYQYDKEVTTTNDDNPLDPIVTMHYYEGNTSGTSFATPFTAGVAANMISRFATVHADEGTYYYDTYLNLPEVFKAGIISIARDYVAGPYDENLTDAQWHSRVGEGGVHYDVDPLLMYMRGVDFSQRSDGKTCFETNDFLDDPNAPGTYMQIDSYTRARAVVVWFNRVDISKINTSEMDRIPNSYTMEIIDQNNTVVHFFDYNGTDKVIADEPNQGYQVINFSTGSRESGRYNVRICKTDRHDNEEVKMGFALTTKPYTPPHPPAPGVMEAITSYLLFQ